MRASELQVGTRVTFKRGAVREVGAALIEVGGLSGVVDHISAEVISITLDTPVAALDEWDNALQFSGSAYDDGEDLATLAALLA